MNVEIQKMRLIVNGAVCVYESQGMDIPLLLKKQGRGDLLEVLDLVTGALYWMQDMLIIEGRELA